MKKINVKKLNQFYMSGNNADALKDLVKSAVSTFMGGENSPVTVALLSDLGLLIEA
jgi:hypothetical protein